MKMCTKIFALLFCLVGANMAYAAVPDQPGSTITCSAATDVEFVPNWGQVSVSQDQYSKYIYQWVYWDSASRMNWFTMNGDSTYEPDAFFGGP